MKTESHQAMGLIIGLKLNDKQRDLPINTLCWESKGHSNLLNDKTSYSE